MSNHTITQQPIRNSYVFEKHEIKIESPFYNDPTGPREGNDFLMQFAPYLTTDLFPPTVLSYAADESFTTVNISALVLIPYPGEVESLDFVITQQHTLSSNGFNQLNILISYETIEATTDVYLPLLVVFTTHPVFINGNSNPESIESIETFLANRDPKTSRGTVTTVKRPM